MEESSLETTKSYFQVPPFEGTLTINSTTFERIKALGSCPDLKEDEKNLERSYIIANLVFAAYFIFNQVKLTMKKYDKDALATNHAADIKGFCFAESVDRAQQFRQEGLEAKLVDIAKIATDDDYFPIISVRGKAALARFMPLIKNDSPIYTLERNLMALTESMNDRNDEVVTVATYVKNKLCQKSRATNFARECLCLFYPVFCLEQKPDLGEWHTRKIFKDMKMSYQLLETKDYYGVFRDWLEKKDVLPIIQDTMAPLLWMYKFLNAIPKYIRLEPVSCNVILESSAQVRFSEAINNALSKLDPYFQKSNELYSAVMGARAAILARSKNKKKEYIQKTTNVFLNLTDDRVFLRLPIKLHISEDNHETATFDIQPKKEKKQKSKPVQKKHHKRHNKRKTVEEPAITEKPAAIPQTKPKKKIIKIIPQQRLIKYAPRIKRWFDGTMDAASAESKFYHTFCPWVDELMIRYGRKSEVPNKTNPHLMDTCYSMDGEVHYKDGKKIIVRCCCVIGHDGKCYHREVNELRDAVSVLMNSYDYHFPMLGSDEYDDRDTTQAQSIGITSEEELNFYGISEYKEDNLCFYLKESRDTRVKRIVLFNPYIE